MKIYVIEEKRQFRDWKPMSADTIRKASNSGMMFYRQLSRIYRDNKKYRLKVYIPLEER